MKLKFISILLAILNSGLMFGTDNDEEYYEITYQNLSCPVNQVETINQVLKGAEAFFQTRNYSSLYRLLARRYLTSEFMKLSKEDLGSVISSNDDLFHNSFFGLSLILGWALHNNSDESLDHLFKKDSKFKYGDYFEYEVAESGIAILVKNLNGVKVRLNSLDDINHYAFYFETIHLPWPSKELRLKSKEKEPAAPNLSKEVQLGSQYNDHYSLNGENTPLLRRPEKKKNAGSCCLCCTIL